MKSETDHDGAAGRAGKPERRATAEAMASKQRDISVSEFFTKNRHLLGFDNPAKALLTTVKEAVDNALDACEEAGILPTIRVEITELIAAAPAKEGQEAKSSRFRVAVEDNGPGIVKAQIPKIFAKLLYGSKFHRLKQSRGQQGIGISAAGLYGQLTTGKPVVIVSKTGKKRPAHRITLRIDTRNNAPDVLSDEELDPNGTDAVSQYWASVEHGTRVEIDLTGTYRAGRTGVDAYLEQTVVANPHLELYYQAPKGIPVHYPRVANELPREAHEIKPHPHGVELGMLLKMMQDAGDKMTVAKALQEDFSKVSSTIAVSVCEAAKIKPNTKAAALGGEEIERLHAALGEAKIPAPSASCVVPIGEPLIVEGLKRRFKADYYTSATRPPAVYRGNPFVIEVGLAFGGDLPAEEPAEILRFANRVPLQYQPRACAITEGVLDTNWKNYELQQPKGSLPIGPLAIFVHLASVWVPFTSEAKEAVAHYPEMLAEIKLALRDVGRRLGIHLRANQRLQADAQRRSIFERYIPEVATSLGKLLHEDRGKFEKMFLDALPNFVRMATEADGAATEGGETTAAPKSDSMMPPADDVPGSERDGASAKPSSKKKPTQRTLDEVAIKHVEGKPFLGDEPDRKGKGGDKASAKGKAGTKKAAATTPARKKKG
jgi:DNA topoisomerase-6 subunit B